MRSSQAQVTRHRSPLSPQNDTVPVHPLCSVTVWEQTRDPWPWHKCGVGSRSQQRLPQQEVWGAHPHAATCFLGTFISSHHDIIKMCTLYCKGWSSVITSGASRRDFWSEISFFSPVERVAVKNSRTTSLIWCRCLDSRQGASILPTTAISAKVNTVTKAHEISELV